MKNTQKLIPLEDRVIILQDEGAKETEGGIILPEQSVRRPPTGTIVAVGPGKGKEEPIGYRVNDMFFTSIEGKEISINDRVVPVYKVELMVGDRVHFYQSSGLTVTHDGKDHIVVRFSDVICRI